MLKRLGERPEKHVPFLNAMRRTLLNYLAELPLFLLFLFFFVVVVDDDDDDDIVDDT